MSEDWWEDKLQDCQEDERSNRYIEAMEERETLLNGVKGIEDEG